MDSVILYQHHTYHQVSLLIKTATTQDIGFFFLFLHILNEIFVIYWNIEKNFKLEIIDYIFRKIIMLSEVNILESLNEYYQKQV